MSSIADAPKWLKPYVFHGVDIEAREDRDQAVGECPLCGKVGKFYVGVADGQWDCKSCGRKGNVYNFIKEYHELCMKAGADYDGLAAERGFLYPESAIEWGVVRSVLTGEWLIPSYNEKGSMNNLYRYCHEPQKNRWRWYSMPGLNHGIHTPMTLYEPGKPNLAILEGPWDGIMFYEVVKRARPEQESYYALTSNEMGSLFNFTNVVAAPGASVFPDMYRDYCADKHVWMMYDNDYPVQHESGVMQPPNGWAGMNRATQTLLSGENKPSTINVMTWGEGGWTPNYADGFDVSDYFNCVNNISDRVKALGGLMANVLPFPEDWMPGRTATAKATGGSELQCLPCNTFSQLEKEFRKALKWNPGMRKGLACMLSTIISTTGVGSQLWMRFISPPSTGKTTFCEAVCVASKYTKPMSHLTGFFSGVKDKENPSEDLGLISKLFNKTLVTKDGDTLLQSDNLGKILSEARDIYDRTARTHFKTGSGRDYGSINMTWILCGTSSLRLLDTSELGERFLTCSIMDKMDEDFEREVQRMVMKRLIRNRGMEANGKPETRHDPQLTRAMALCGGYVEYLRENATGLQEAVIMSEQCEEDIMDMALFVAFLRARPSLKQEEIVVREFSPRLTEQLGRLAICLAAVLNKREVDTEVMDLVRSVAIDTSCGITFDMARAMMDSGETGIEPRNLAMFTHETTNKANDLLRFMRKIGVVETFTAILAPGVRSKPKWRLTSLLRRLWSVVVNNEIPTDIESTNPFATAEASPEALAELEAIAEAESLTESGIAADESAE